MSLVWVLRRGAELREVTGKELSCMFCCGINFRMYDLQLPVFLCVCVFHEVFP